MNRVKLCGSEDGQTLFLPEEYQIQGDEVYIKKVGNAIVLIPKDDPWQVLFQSLDLFSTDFMESRTQPEQTARETLFE